MDFGDVPVKPQRVYKEINEFFDEDTVFVTAIGQDLQASALPLLRAAGASHPGGLGVDPGPSSADRRTSSKKGVWTAAWSQQGAPGARCGRNRSGCSRTRSRKVN
jgi:hypothetical protein